MSVNVSAWPAAVRRVQKRAHELLEVADPHDRVGRQVNRFLVAFILLNVLAVIVESVGWVASRYQVFFAAFEHLSIAVFAIEYLTRLWACTYSPKYSRPVLGRLRFAITPLALVDLIVLLPVVLTSFTFDLRFVRALRVLRTLRVWKLSRYSNALQSIRTAFKETGDQLIAAFAIMAVIIVISSGLMYVVEHPAQPEKFSSVIASMWWTMQTLTMISYADMTPITTVGRFLSVVIGLVGIGMFAMPAGILASAFIEQIKRARAKKECCPHCGHELENT